MTDWRKDVYADSDWLHHWDIEGSSPVTVTIEGYAHKEAFNPGTKEKGVLWALSFKGATKALGVNVTNLSSSTLGRTVTHGLASRSHSARLYARATSAYGLTP